MRTGVITDEVSQDFEEALRFAGKFDLDCVELRSAYEKGPFDYSEKDIQKIKKLSDAYGVPVTAVSSPMFKCEYTKENILAHTESFERLLEYALTLGADKIRCFDFFKNDDVTREMVIEAFERPYELCENAGVTIVIESEPTTNSQCCKDISELVRAFDKPYFKALYDPGNNIYSSDEIPYPDGFSHIKDIFCHVHIKDAVLNGGVAEGECIGKGLVDYEGIFSELHRMNYEGDVMLETHYRLPGNSTLSEKTLANPKGSAISENGYEASCVCMKELKKIIEATKI